jgi:hypothetical protein
MPPEPGLSIDAEAITWVVSEGSLSLVLGASARAPMPAELRRADMSEEVAEEFREIASAHIQRAAASRPIEFDAGYALGSDEVFVQPAAAYGEDSLISQVMHPSALDLFQTNDPSFGSLTMYAFVAQHEGRSAAFLRRSNQIHVGRTKRFLGLIREGRLESLEEPVLAFDERIDVLVFESVIAIFNAAPFQLMFREASPLRLDVEKHVATVVAYVPIANADQFVEACQRDPRMMTKLARLVTRSYLPGLGLQQVKDQIQRYNLPPELVNENGELVYWPDPHRRWMILKILDDDYLESAMTNQKYEVNSKLEH